MRVPKSVMAVCGVVVAAAAIGFTNPKAVHALTAALVQVTNTAANPVVSRDVTLSPTQLVELYCPVGQHNCYQMQPGGLISPNGYSVPDSQALVITDVEIHTPKDDGIINFYIAPVGDCTSCSEQDSAISYFVSDDGLTHHFSLTRGIVWPASNYLIPNAASYGSENSSLVFAHLYGYLTNN